MNMKTLLMGVVASVAIAPTAFAERGSDGELKIILWQAPSIMNPYLSGGSKDMLASSLVIEPLARFNESGEITPWLVAEVPTVENGGVSEDLTSITWKILPGLTWSDGSALTAEDVKFTYEYCTHADIGCAFSPKFEGVTKVETPDELTVVVTFGAATPYPYGPFVGSDSPILQKAQFAECMGEKAPACTEQNFGPIGTGPFVVEDFKPNDAITLVANENYRDAAKPFFSNVVVKGGGDATSAGRAVLETGEFDYATNLQLAPDVLAQMEAGGKGVAVASFGPLVERLMLNRTNPSAELGPEERSIVGPHPFLSDPAVYKAMSMAIDRELLVEVGYGKAGKPTCSWVPAPAAYANDPENCAVQDIAGANALLDAAGIVDTDGDGIREKDEVALKILFQSSTNAVRQDFQALIKQFWSEIGIETELRNINSSVFFGSDPGSPDTYQKFYADVQMYADGYRGADPQSYFGRGQCVNAPRPETQWQGENVSRFCDEEYEALFATLKGEANAAKRIEIGRKLNEIIFQKGVMIPLVHRGGLSGHSKSLSGVALNVWDTDFWNIADWRRIK